MLNRHLKITQLSTWCTVSLVRYIRKWCDLILLRKRQTARGRQETMSNSVFIHTGCFPSVPRPAGTSRRFDTNTDKHTHIILHHWCLQSLAVFVCCVFTLSLYSCSIQYNHGHSLMRVGERQTEKREKREKRKLVKICPVFFRQSGIVS